MVFWLLILVAVISRLQNYALIVNPTIILGNIFCNKHYLTLNSDPTRLPLIGGLGGGAAEVG